VHAQWATNEKVALEVALGASVAGVRAMACMKHVGVNVAADPLFTAAYTGVNGGLVIVAADDPGMHSSQNEQDSRFYAQAAHIPMLEPADSEECRAFVKQAFELSEAYDTPVFLRLTTRIAHARSLTCLEERVQTPEKEYEKNPKKYVMMPANAIGRHVSVEARETRLAQDCNTLPVNRVEMADTKIGVITSGTAYQYVKEAMPGVSVLKLGMVYPLPEQLIRSFAKKVETLYVVEELEPFFETQLKAWGIACQGKEKTGRQGELSVRKVAQAFGFDVPEAFDAPQAPVRPPVLCPGCPHRAVFYTIAKLKLRCIADIGCYTLGALAPLSAVDTVVCMGASIGMGTGMDKARGHAFSKGTVSVIGDSTFLHSGVTGLIDMVYNQSTGHGFDSGQFDYRHDRPSAACGNRQGYRRQSRAAAGSGGAGARLRRKGCSDGGSVDLPALEKAIRAANENEAPSVVICRRPCALIIKEKKKPVTVENCRNCGMCMKIGCPAMIRTEKGVVIDESLCTGCGLCTQVCKFGCLKEGK
jgi:indolepyruvate ferredoxin oxidoreductase alpha subunit